MSNNSIVYLVVFLAFVALTAVAVAFLKSRNRNSDWQSKVTERLAQIQSRKGLDPKLLVIELDKLAEFALQQKFNSKLSLGQILKEKKSKFSKKTLDEVWAGHKFRNNLVHEFNFKATPTELGKASKQLKGFVQDLF